MVRAGWKGQVGRLLSWPERTLRSSATVERLSIRFARLWRPHLTHALVVGVAGSAGKSTTRHLVEVVLTRGLGQGVSTPLASLFAITVASAVLQVRSRHRFLAAEMHEGIPGFMRTIASILQPDVAIVTVARDDHASAFASKADLFDEIAELLRHVPASGVAILNLDDPTVMAMRASCRGRVVTFGIDERADVRAEAVFHGWPSSVRMNIVHGDERVSVQTRMFSEHAVPALLAATACGLVAGMKLPQIAKALSDVEPFEGRMQATRSRDGVDFIRDDYKAPQWTVPSCIEFLRRAEARRKVLVLGEVSDVDGSKTVVLQRLVRDAVAVADLVVAVGPWSSAVLKLKLQTTGDRVHCFTRTREASAFVNAWLQPGDLVLLKGSNKRNHLARILLERDGEIQCWRDDCNLDRFCNVCDDRLKPAGPSTQVIRSEPSDLPTPYAHGLDYLVLGLGNADETLYANTPHNVGFALVDRIARDHGLAWQVQPWGWHVDLQIDGQWLRLLKLRSVMNQIGPKLMPLLAILALPPERCILVFDDVAMPLGKIKLRERGSAGGHRGVASILEAAQSDSFPRMKIGVALADVNTPLADFVLQPLPAESMSALESMLAQGEVRLKALLQDLRSRADATRRAADATGLAAASHSIGR